jgi:hypothetical protein
VSETAKLAAALAQVQAKLPKLDRDRTVTVETKRGEPYSYSYVTLARLSEVVLPLLAQHGLAFTAMPGVGSDGKMCVRYSLMHESGERLDGEFPVSGEGGIQMVGGRITYIRRYCLAAVVGVAADEDDESNLAQDGPPRPAQRKQRGGTQRQQGTPVQRSAPAAGPPLPTEAGGRITDPQLAKVSLLFNKVDGWSDRDDRLRAASAIVGRSVASSKELTKAEAHKLIDTLEQVTQDADPTERLTALVAQARSGAEDSR